MFTICHDIIRFAFVFEALEFWHAQLHTVIRTSFVGILQLARPITTLEFKYIDTTATHPYREWDIIVLRSEVGLKYSRMILGISQRH